MPAGAQPVAARRLGVAGGREPDQRRAAGHGHGGVDALGAAEGEVHQLRAARGQAAAGRLGGHRGLEGDLVEQGGLDQLRLGDRRGRLQQRLAREHHPAFRDRPDVPGEPQPPERLDGRPVKAEGVGQPGQLALVEAETLQEGQAVLQPGADQEPAVRRQLAHEQAEGRRPAHPPAQVAGGHVQLVQVGDQPAGQRSHAPASSRIPPRSLARPREGCPAPDPDGLARSC